MVSWIKDYMRIKPIFRSDCTQFISISGMVFRTKNKTWPEVNNRYPISFRTCRLAAFQNYLASCSTDSSTVHRFHLFFYFNGSKIFPWNNHGLVYDFILPQNASIFRDNKYRWSHSCFFFLENNLIPNLCRAVAWLNLSNFEPIKLRYLSSVANKNALTAAISLAKMRRLILHETGFTCWRFFTSYFIDVDTFYLFLNWFSKRVSDDRKYVCGLRLYACINRWTLKSLGSREITSLPEK